MLPSLKEGDIIIGLCKCHFRWIYSYGDYYCFIKEYDNKEILKSEYKGILHFGQRNTDLKKIYFNYKHNDKDIGELIKILTYAVYGKNNWSNNDRKRRGLNAIRIKEYMKKRNSQRH